MFNKTFTLPKTRYLSASLHVFLLLINNNYNYDNTRTIFIDPSSMAKEYARVHLGHLSEIWSATSGHQLAKLQT